MRRGESPRQSGLPLRIAQPIRVQAEQGRGCRIIRLEALHRSVRLLDAELRRTHFLHAVEDQPGERHAVLVEPIDEVGGLAQRIALGGGDHHERRTRILEQGVRGLRALAEPAEHRVDRADERGQIREQLRAEDLGEHAGEEAESRTEQLAEASPGTSCRSGEDLDEASVEEGAQAVGSIEEVQRRARGGRVDHDEVPGAVSIGLGAQLPELLHRHVLLRAREGGRQRLVERVVEDRLGALRVGVGLDDLVEGPLHVEHHRAERALSLDADDRARGVVEFGEPHGLGETSRRIDGEHADSPAHLRGAQTEGRGRRGLADATRAAAHDDARRGIAQERVDVERGDVGHQAIPCSCSMSASS